MRQDLDTEEEKVKVGGLGSHVQEAERWMAQTGAPAFGTSVVLVNGD
jgi:hypothetical protein